MSRSIEDQKNEIALAKENNRIENPRSSSWANKKAKGVKAKRRQKNKASKLSRRINR